MDSLPRLPSEVVVLILKHVSVTDVGTARLVSRTWKDTVDRNAWTIWKAQCKRLGMLPDEDETIIGWTGQELLSAVYGIRARSEYDNCNFTRGDDVVEELMRIYRCHYLKWAKHLCDKCDVFELSDLKACCTPLNKIWWIDPRVACCAIMGNVSSPEYWIQHMKPSVMRAAPSTPLGPLIRYDDVFKLVLAKEKGENPDYNEHIKTSVCRYTAEEVDKVKRILGTVIII